MKRFPVIAALCASLVLGIVASCVDGDSVLVTPTVTTAAADTPTIFGSSSDTTVAKIHSTGVERARGDPTGVRVLTFLP
ncbi:MAG: hypothetical protein VX815_11095 [Gemmatimonadota bacterium]|jgi:hypothetical protein|nr:hypothetical protein [Gemmatimonadota bacterium]